MAHAAALASVASAAEGTRPAISASALALPVTAPRLPGCPPDPWPLAAVTAESPESEAPAGLVAQSEPTNPSSGANHPRHLALSAERTQAMLRSLTVPGWGQATLGHGASAKVFGLVELGVWASYASFKIQERMRRDSYELTAKLLAGIELNGRDEEFRRIVGSYLSSQQYNELVVYRDAANLYYDSPDQYWAYIEANSLRGRNTWEWQDEAALLRYQGQRKDAQRAGQRANAALGAAIVNRLVSVLHVARLVPALPSGSWELETLPDPNDPTAFRTGIRTRF